MPDIIQGVPFVFYGEVFTAYLANDRQWYLILQDVCQALGLDVSGQRQRIQRDEALSDYLVNISIEAPYGETTRQREIGCLNLRRLPYWLGTIDASRVKEEHRRKVILFKREFAEAAWAVFRSDIIPSELLGEMDAYETPPEREYSQLMDQARQLRLRMDLLSGKMEAELERVGGEVSDLAGRLGILEAKLIGRQIVNAAQAKQLQDMIALVADSLHEKTPRKSRSQCFADVHQGFKDTFHIHIYSTLPADQMEQAITFLAGWYSRLNPGRNLPDLFQGSHHPSLL
jgi:hypothetical protein